MQDFRQLKVWAMAHQLALQVYRSTKSYPPEELYGVTNQMRRCSTSIPANIAEGCGRGSDVDFARFLQTAMGSASELEYFLLLSRDLEYLATKAYEDMTQTVVELKRMLTALMQKLRSVK